MSRLKVETIKIKRHLGALFPRRVSPIDPQGSMQTQEKKHGKQATVLSPGERMKRGKNEQETAKLSQNRRTESQWREETDGLFPWLTGRGVGVTRKRSTNKNKKHHTGSANIPGSPRQPKTAVGGHRRHVLKFYLVGQSANPTGWPAQDNWRLGTYIHQRPLPWRWRLRALPRPSCLCPSARVRGTGTKTDIWESVTNFCTMVKRLVRRNLKDHHPWHYIRTTNKKLKV